LRHFLTLTLTLVLQTLMDAKLSLELEIAAYRKLLEVEENRSETDPPRGLHKYLAATSRDREEKASS
jgi:hypothetical protein